MTRESAADRDAGFTLVELSIVLVIVGLIVGGVLAGSEMIAHSRLRQVSKEMQGYQTAYATFRLKYADLPGDTTRASSYFTGVPNGNADGTISWPDEGVWAWLELSQAGLVPGTFTAAAQITPGANVPASAYSAAIGYAFAYESGSPFNGNFGMSGNVLHFGTPSGGLTTKYAAMIPRDARDIDRKLDDGVGDSGKLRAWDNGWNPGCTSGVAPNEDYSLSAAAPLCALLIAL